MDKVLKIEFRDKQIPISVLNMITLLYFGRGSFLNLARAVGISLPLMVKLVVCPCIVLLGYYTFRNIRRICWDGIFLFASVAFFFMITLKIHPEYLNRYRDIYFAGRFSASAVFQFGSGMYCYYIIRLYQYEGEKLYRFFRRFPYLLLVLNIGRIFNRDSEYKMDFGYQMELIAILFLMQYLHDADGKRKLNMSIAVMFLGVIYGSRACIIGYVVFAAVYILWKRQFSTRQVVLVSMGLSAALLYNSQAAMQFLYHSVVQLGLQSRTLYLIANGNILASDTARQDRIWPLLIHYLSSIDFFYIPGAYADRYLLPYYYPYAHNIALEMLLTFGKFWGGLLMLLILSVFLRLFKTKKDETCLLMIAFFCFSICRLAVSSSFWIEPYFWAMLALMVNCNARPRNQDEEEEEQDCSAETV